MHLASWLRRRAEPIFRRIHHSPWMSRVQKSSRWRGRTRQHAGRVRYPETAIAASANDLTRTRAGRLRDYEPDDRATSDETFARKFAEYLARNRSSEGATQFDHPNRRQRDLPAASGYREGLCFYQPGRRDRRCKCNYRARLVRTGSARDL